MTSTDLSDPSASAPAPGEAPVTREMIREGLARLREIHEAEVRPEEGLRERKKRLTRQLISDTATWMFCSRGFDRVRVSEVAVECGVSEKTVFNYFPTKESLVFDREDAVMEGMRDAIVGRAPDASPTQAVLAFIEHECRGLGAMGDDSYPLFLAFMRMLNETPALLAARHEMVARLVDVVREALAASADVDPRDPEPHIAAQALIGLWEVQLRSRERHIRAGVPADALIDAVLSDTRRAARLLDTGLWSFNRVAAGSGAQAPLSEAVRSANEMRKQVFEALRQARAAWDDLRGRDHDDAPHPRG